MALVKIASGHESQGMLFVKGQYAHGDMVNQLLHETWDVPRSAQRLRELIVYISLKCEADPAFGAIKLNKVLYYSDFKAFERFGVPLTGFRYSRLQFGPAPKALVSTRRALVEEGAIKAERVQLAPGINQERTVALRAPVLEHFTADEIAIVDEVIAELWHLNATQVSDASHDLRWNALQHDDPLPYEMAYLLDEPPSPQEIERTRQLADQLGW